MSADAGKPSTWAPFRKGLCEGCWAECCTLPVEVSGADLIRLGILTEDELRASPRKAFKKLQRDGVLQAFRLASGLCTLQQKPNGDCIFLDRERRCSVYETRPQVCRDFPSIGPRPGFCPAKKGLTRATYH